MIGNSLVGIEQVKCDVFFHNSSGKQQQQHRSTTKRGGKKCASDLFEFFFEFGISSFLEFTLVN